MSDYIEITLDPPGVRPAWLGVTSGNRDAFRYRRVSFHPNAFLTAFCEPDRWHTIVQLRIPKDSPAYARYLASKKPETAANDWNAPLEAYHPDGRVWR